MYRSCADRRPCAAFVSMQDDRDAFYVCDLGDVMKKHLRWARALPRITPFYAVKCNDSRAVVMTLASLGTGFDCASKVKKAFHGGGCCRNTGLGCPDD